MTQARPSRNDTVSRGNFFIISVDRIFTALIEPLFTNFFDATSQNARIACLCRVRHAD
jgi:hypothetical protein